LYDILGNYEVTKKTAWQDRKTIFYAAALKG